MTDEEVAAEEQAEALRAKAEIEVGKIAPVMIDNILEIITRLQKPFSKLSEFQQKDLIDNISRKIRAGLTEAMPMLAQSTDEQRIAVHLSDFTVKDDTIKLKLECTKTPPALQQLGSVGQATELHLFIADTRLVDDYSKKVKTKAQPNQPDMLEEDGDEQAEPEANDDDLAEAGEAVAEQETMQ